MVESDGGGVCSTDRLDEKDRIVVRVRVGRLAMDGVARQRHIGWAKTTRELCRTGESSEETALILILQWKSLRWVCGEWERLRQWESVSRCDCERSRLWTFGHSSLIAGGLSFRFQCLQWRTPPKSLFARHAASFYPPEDVTREEQTSHADQCGSLLRGAWCLIWACLRLSRQSKSSSQILRKQLVVRQVAPSFDPPRLCTSLISLSTYVPVAHYGRQIASPRAEGAS